MSDHAQELMEINAQLRERVLRHAGQGRTSTAVEGLHLAKREQPDRVVTCMEYPIIAVTLQGSKHSTIGSKTFQYGPNTCLVAGVDMPTVSHITEASPQKPYLSVSLKMDRRLATQLSTDAPLQPKQTVDSYWGMSVAVVSRQVLDAFARMVALLDNPEQISVLAPLLIREIHYCVLIGPQGECMRQVATLGSQSHRIAKAISWLRENYSRPMHVEDLADMADMGTSTFHRHFKQVTTLSPLQYQKHLRLHEAQRLMVAENKDASSASLAVGYESPTQFNREYKRLFGEPPHRDVSRMR